MVAAPVERISANPARVEPAPGPSRRTRKAPRLRPGARLAWLGVCVLLLAWQCLAQQAAIVELSFQLTRLQAEQEALNQQVLRLTLEKARLASLARVEQVARTQLGMVEPGQVRVVHVTPVGPGSSPALALAQTAPQEGRWWERALARILPGRGVAEALSGQRP